MYRRISAVLLTVTTLLWGLTIRVRVCAGSRLRRAAADERGDVPGWVMITVMSAAIVAALLGIAMPELKKMLNDALDEVGK